MAVHLSTRAKNTSPSATLAMAAIAKQMKAEGIDVVDFGLGEPDFETPDHIKEAAITAIREGFTRYTAAAGIDELKQAIITKLKRDNGLSYGPAEVIVSCGSKHSLFNIAEALFESGDEIIIPAPYWVTYTEQIRLVDARPVIVPTREEDGFHLTRAALESAITPKTKAILLNSPCNPTGAMIPLEQLRAIAALVVERDLLVISDEAYESLTYDGHAHMSIASLDEQVKRRTIVVNTVSKAYAMTGWRIGYAAGPAEIVKAMSTIQSQVTSNPTSIAQKAAVAALLGPHDDLRAMVVEFDRRRKYLISRLNAIPGITCTNPEGAFYLFPNVSTFYGTAADDRPIRNSTEMAAYLLQTAHVVSVPGSEFGSDAHLRLSYATGMDSIGKGAERIERALGALRKG
ncbi:MAG: pyridoxal phosphate-dependent aminotransferase [Candidatus Methylomirabilis oxygeniifera]|uniref:Aspartate aminotransferase A (AspAT) n=1 Tax=Methylomirabilis oxygeniifera TaxID=671143 RepID=D5MFB9_METO1|nr:MAG: pyridoxal phosphate-dependent aminotransferase [Candidatus Methylomirabilis oxyfera]CBE68448.1 aspartate aminotransferase A (AspAT) [Candidatus Methylomirabilis oxyfera]